MDVVEGESDDKGEVDTNVDNDNNTDKNDKGEDDGVKNDLGEGEKMDDGEGVDFFFFGNGSTSPVFVELYKTIDKCNFFSYSSLNTEFELCSRIVH